MFILSGQFDAMSVSSFPDFKNISTSFNCALTRPMATTFQTQLLYQPSDMLDETMTLVLLLVACLLGVFVVRRPLLVHFCARTEKFHKLGSRTAAHNPKTYKARSDTDQNVAKFGMIIFHLPGGLVSKCSLVSSI